MPSSGRHRSYVDSNVRDFGEFFRATAALNPSGDGLAGHLRATSLIHQEDDLICNYTTVKPPTWVTS